MRLHSIIKSYLVARLVSRQNVLDLPSCAKYAALEDNLFPKYCDLSDYACFCNDKKFIESLPAAFEANCNPGEAQEAIQFMNSFCSQYAGTTQLPATSVQPASGAQGEPKTSTSASSTAVWTTKGLPGHFSSMMPTLSPRPPAMTTTAVSRSSQETSGSEGPSKLPAMATGSVSELSSMTPSSTSQLPAYTGAASKVGGGGLEALYSLVVSMIALFVQII